MSPRDTEADAIAAVTVGRRTINERLAQDDVRVVDPGKCALALFVTADGHVRIQGRLDTEQMIEALEQITARLRARGDRP